MFRLWLALPGWAILLSIMVVYGATALAMYVASFGRRGTPRLASLSGIVPPFLGLPTLMFGLMAGFLASDVWYQASQLSRAVLDERDAAILIEDIDQVTPAIQIAVDGEVHEYIRAVLAEEIPAANERGSPRVSAALDRLMREIASPKVATEAGPSVQSALLNAVARLSAARSTRLALSGIGASEFKWTAVACLALLAQAAVAAVHLERARAQMAALVLFTGSVVAVLALIAVCEQPFRGSHQTSTIAPLASALSP